MRYRQCGHFSGRCHGQLYQNEDTLDGKTNTHSMADVAAVLYQRWGTLNDDESIPRTGEKALEVTECTEEPLH